MYRILRSGWTIGAAVLTFGLATVAAQAPAGNQNAAPGAQAPAGPRGGGAGRGGGRGGGRGMTPSQLRSVAAETTMAKVKDPNWKAPRNTWGQPDLEGTFSSDDFRGVPMSRPAQFGDRASLTPEEFLQRASGDEASRFSAVNQETFLRNEFGVRTFGYTSVIVEPANGQMPALTAAARRRADAVRGVGTFGTRPLDGFEDFSLYDRCITRGVPGSVTPVLYGNGVRIVQTPTEVVLTYEMIHDTRVIPLDGRPRLDAAHRQWIGDSRGRFDGDTLVVETTNFTDRTSVSGAPHTPQMKLTEWFTRVDPEMIEYRFRVEDPDTYAAPFTARYILTTQPGYYLYEYGCHEGNTAVRQGLSSERAYEREVAEARAKGRPVPPRVNRGMEVYGAPDRDAVIRDLNKEN